MTNHPLLRELRDMLLDGGDVPSIRAHLDECLACRVRMARIAHADGLRMPSPDVFQGIVDASTAIPVAVNIPVDRSHVDPERGELWRIGGDEALLAWVRKNFHDGAVDIVPVVLDAELADELTVIVDEANSPLAVELGAMVALRTHVHRDAFINRLGSLDIAEEIEDAIAAIREGRSATARVGSPVESDSDDRIEYRQALRDLLNELSPSRWPGRALPMGAPATFSPTVATADLQSQIQHRIRAARCMRLPIDQLEIGPGRSLQPLFKVAYLNTSVVVVSVDSLNDALVDEVALIRACQRAMDSSPDADAVCVAEPGAEWNCVLYSTASMRGALELPHGRSVGPEPILVGFGVVDTLSKYLEGAAPAWEVTERAPRGLGAINLAETAGRHVRLSLAGIEQQGRSARQAAKRATWTALPTGLEGHVLRFITAVIESDSAATAVSDFLKGASRD